MLKVGDKVIRVFCGIEMPLTVTAISEDCILCGDWEFDPITGAEIDECLGWGSPPLMTGSFLKRPF